MGEYFADMLSAIESNESIPLYEGGGKPEKTISGKDIPPTIRLPDNLFIISTVNMDETTYMFSPQSARPCERDRISCRELEDLQNYLKTPGRKPDLSASFPGKVHHMVKTSYPHKSSKTIAPDFPREIEDFFVVSLPRITQIRI